ALLPITLTVLVMMVGFVGRLIPRVGAKPMMIAGLTVLAGGIALFARTPIGGSFTNDVLEASLLAGIGISLTHITALVHALAGAGRRKTPARKHPQERPHSRRPSRTDAVHPNRRPPHSRRSSSACWESVGPEDPGSEWGFPGRE